MNRIHAAALAAFVVATPAAAQQATPLLHPLFQDHGVLQRDRPIAVWGTAAPGERLQLRFNGATVASQADRQGHWRAELPATPAGGPYVLTVTAAGGASQRVEDLLVGDVWLCSGQSNMELGVERALNAAGEIASANHPDIRLMTIEHKTSIDPERRFLTPVAWQPVTPQTIADFSAACYFMARDLKATEKVPMGLIDSSWGGTAIDAWRGEKALLGDASAQDALALFRVYRADRPRASRMFGERWMDWYRAAAKDPAGAEPWQVASSGWRTLPSFEAWEN